MLSIIVLIPGIWAAYLAFTQSPHYAFLKIYVPVLLLIPNYYYWKPPVIPDPNFNEATSAAIVFIWLIRGARGWHFTFTDILVVGFAASVGYSEYINAGYKEAQNLMFDMVTAVLFPYMMAKCFIEPNNLGIAFAKSFVVCLFIVAVLSVHQFLSGSYYTIWQYVFGRFFSGQGWGWATSLRWGFTRIPGPYGHAILACLVLVIAYRLQRWLEWSQAWPLRLPQLAWLPITFPHFLLLGITIGAAMTMSRGPWIGGVLAALISMIARSRKRWLIFGTIFISSALLSIPITKQFYDYVSVGRQDAGGYGSTQETAAYRFELIGTYIEIGSERLWQGWGRTGFLQERDKTQKSIDNYYLLMFLMHGIMGLGFLLAIFVVMMLRLFFHAMAEPLPVLPGSSLGFTLLGLYAVVAWSAATVFLGEQTITVFFLIVGWSDGYLHSRPRQVGTKIAETPLRKTFHFRRILT